MHKSKPLFQSSFLHGIPKAPLTLSIFVTGQFAMPHANARMQAEGNLCPAEATLQIGTASHSLLSDLAIPAMLAITMLGLAVHLYRIRKIW